MQFRVMGISNDQELVVPLTTRASCLLGLNGLQWDNAPRRPLFERTSDPSSHVNFRLFVTCEERVLEQLRVGRSCSGVL